MATQILKRALVKLCQETSEHWVKLLPVALMRIRGSSKATTRLSQLEMMLYGRPFLTLELIFDTETHQSVKYIINLNKVYNKQNSTGIWK